MSVFFSRNNDSHCIYLVFLFETAVKSACKLKRLSVEINSRQKNVSNQFFLKISLLRIGNPFLKKLQNKKMFLNLFLFLLL